MNRRKFLKAGLIWVPAFPAIVHAQSEDWFRVASEGAPAASGGGGSFGGSALLDNFNRANAALGGSTASGGGTWTFAAGSGTDNNISTNAVQSAGSGGDSISTSVTADCEAFFTLVNVGGSPNGSDYRAIALRSNSTLATGYFLRVYTDTNWQITSGTIGGISLATGTQTIAANSFMGFEAIGTSLKGYYKPNSGGSWSVIVSATDATYSAAGLIGIFESGSTYGVRLDDLHGGSR